uniref:Uncharacterized protein n=1 Tax=Rhizophora mucronata TaxID=61149 RepID=A0A2P2PZ47_RHIMU
MLSLNELALMEEEKETKKRIVNIQYINQDCQQIRKHLLQCSCPNAYKPLIIV